MLFKGYIIYIIQCNIGYVIHILHSGESTKKSGYSADLEFINNKKLVTDIEVIILDILTIHLNNVLLS